MKRRLLRYALIALAVVLFTGYFAFRTFFFDPLEGRYGAKLATLVPRDVDFFSAKANLADDFVDFPTPRLARELAAHPVGQRFLASSQWQTWSRDLGLVDMEATIRAELDKAGLPAGLDPTSLFGGRELALAAYLKPGGTEAAEWIALGRTNWMGKLALELLERPDWIGLSEQGLEATGVEGGVRLSGGQLARPLFLGRRRDVLLIATSESFLLRAEELEQRKGQDSFGQSARYHDHVEAKATVLETAGGQPVEFYGDVAKSAAALGLPTEWPNPKSPEPWVVFLSRLFQLGEARDLAGVLSIGRALRLDANVALSPEEHSTLQRRMYRMRGFDRGPVLNDVARLAPADTGLFAYLQSDLAGLMREWLAVQEPALRENLVSHLVRPLFGGSSVDKLVDELDAAFRDQVAVIVRANDYPDMGPDGPPHNDTVVPAWAVVLWVESREKIDELRQKVIQNQARFGIQGRASGSSGVFTNEVQGGFVVYEYWSPAIQGTGHLSSVNDGQLFVLSNSYQMIGQVLGTYYQGGARNPRLADQVDFQNLMQEGQASSTVLAYLQPAGLVPTLAAMGRRTAEDDLLTVVDWQAKRVEFGKAVVAERFPSEVWGRLSTSIQDQVDVEVDKRVEAFQQELRERELPRRLEAVNEQMELLRGVDGALVQLRLTERALDLAVRALFAAAARP